MSTLKQPTATVRRVLGTAAALALCAGLALPGRTLAHCDTLDGPVVMAARKALESGKADPILIWVKTQDEGGIRGAFERALAVRKLSPEARALADTWFFETLVRVHRAGEGAPFTGLKPAGLDLGPAIPAADRALETGDPEALVRLITGKVEAGLRERFERARGRKSFAPADVAAGREYIEAYVPFLHYVERLYADATSDVAHHPTDAEPDAHPAEGEPSPH